MKIQLQSVLKKLILILFWIIFPPLFLVFSIIWKTPKLTVRILLTAVAPLTLVVLFMGLFQMQQYYYYHFERGSRTELEAKTGLKFPDYQTIEKRHFLNGPSFNGDFTIEFTIKLDTANIQDFYRQIDHKTRDDSKNKEEVPTSYWSSERDGNYSFTCFGDPKDKGDETLELHIDKKNALIKITYGAM